LEDNIRMDLRDTEWKSIDWMHLAVNRDQKWAFVDMVMELRVP
jgi:hypothetical protein